MERVHWCWCRRGRIRCGWSSRTRERPTYRGRPHVPYRLQMMTDLNLHALVVSGLRSGFEHYLAGPGPAVVLTTESGSAASPLVSVADISKPPPPMTLCRSLVRGTGG